MTRGPRAALTVSMSSVGSVPLAGGLVVGMPQARRAETGEWSALTEAEALYTDNVSDWSVTRRLHYQRISASRRSPPPTSQDVAESLLMSGVSRGLLLARPNAR